VAIDGVLLFMIGLIEHLQNVTTNNYDSLTKVHSSKTLRGFSVFTSRCLVAASNGGRSPSSGFPNCPLPQLPSSVNNGSQRLNLSCSLTISVTQQPTKCLITPRHVPHRKHLSSLLWFNFCRVNTEMAYALFISCVLHTP
jgi:hypothetical protein